MLNIFELKSHNQPYITMEKTYENVSYFVVIILAFVLWGFYRTYFGLFPTFQGITNLQHFHGFMLVSWFAMLIAQPFLIRYKKYELHRSFGKLAYVQVPLILLSIFLVTEGQFHRMEPLIPRALNLGALALNLPTIVVFGTLYMLAMISKKNTAYHMRYMIATSFLMLGPGIARAFIIYGHMPFPMAIDWSMMIEEELTIGFILYDFMNKRPYKPYLITLLMLVGIHLLWAFRMSAPWQEFAGIFSGLLF